MYKNKLIYLMWKWGSDRDGLATLKTKEWQNITRLENTWRHVFK